MVQDADVHRVFWASTKYISYGMAGICLVIMPLSSRALWRSYSHPVTKQSLQSITNAARAPFTSQNASPQETVRSLLLAEKLNRQNYWGFLVLSVAGLAGSVVQIRIADGVNRSKGEKSVWRTLWLRD